MKRIFFLTISMIVVFSSCKQTTEKPQSQSQSESQPQLQSESQTQPQSQYQYIEILEEQTLMTQGKQVETEAVVIEASHDTLAYMKAMEKFLHSNKKNVDIIESGAEKFWSPIDFKLIDETGKDISKTTDFKTKKQYEDEMFEKIFQGG